MKHEYLEKIYAGWLAKIIGVRIGAPIEGWTYEKIKNVYGELNGYVMDLKKYFAADDDSNGPLFFIRALEDGIGGFDLTAQAVGEALLNYAPYEHGFFWWGGYGVSTEHTAYLNLRNGIKAPESGSTALNGHAVAEQIGGQIFIDSWGLVTPGNPDLAAKYAGMAASVSHDGNGVYGGIFVAVCISYAFDETNICNIIEKGLSYIPADSEYTRVVRAVMAYYDEHPDNWRDCFAYIYDNFGYDKYPGSCHIIPNTAVMILSLLYGEGDFARTLDICNMCGWDTDCNVGNIATIMGVVCGLEAIDQDQYRKQINDLLISSSVTGSLNITDIPYGASYFAKLAWAIAGEELPLPWNDIIENRIDSCHFEYPGSTHAMCVRVESKYQEPEIMLINSDETANTGSRSLKAVVKPLRPGERVYLYKRTHFRADEFHNSRYDPSFSPLLYPGQTVHGSVCLPEYAEDCRARLYARNSKTGEIFTGESIILKKGEWTTLSYQIPHIEAGLIDEAGFAFDLFGNCKPGLDFICFVDDFYYDGTPDYTVDFQQETMEMWNYLHKEITQFTRLKGNLYLADGKLHLSCTDFGEAYTGHHDWSDYTAAFTMTPLVGERHLVNVRVQGAIRSYAAGLIEDGKLGLFKNENGYRELCKTDFAWESGKSYTLSVSANGADIVAAVDGRELLAYTDKENPYMKGSIGVSVQNGSHCSYSSIVVK